MKVLIEGEGVVELNQGLLVNSTAGFDSGLVGSSAAARANQCPGVVGLAGAMAGDNHELEAVIVSQWLHANVDRVRILDVEGSEGLSMPAARIPTLRELTGASTGEADTS